MVYITNIFLEKNEYIWITKKKTTNKVSDYRYYLLNVGKNFENSTNGRLEWFNLSRLKVQSLENSNWT
jgi:hypothetical protein